MARLDKEHKGLNQFSFLSTHPLTSERVERVRMAGEEMDE
jgi:predicted Zn-dependent protease